jgi:hypothetical protein
MPAGIPGEVTRGAANAVIEPQVVTPFGTTGAPTAYGVPMVVDATGGNVGNMRTMAAGDTTAYGLLVRPFPTVSSQDVLGTSTPPANGACDILKSGYMTVLLSGSTAAIKGGPVYIWTATASGSHIVGGFEATNPSSSGIAFTGAYFMGPADASNNVEIAVNP